MKNAVNAVVTTSYTIFVARDNCGIYRVTCVIL